MKQAPSAVRWAVGHPKATTAVMVAVTLTLAVLAALPSVWPRTFTMLHGVEVDTDPENMLPEDEPVRVFHDRMKEQLKLHDMVVAGVVNETDADGVFNPVSLARVYYLTELARTLQWPDPAEPDRTEGVVEVDIIAPSMVDNVEGRGGQVRFEWLMPAPPLTAEAARAVRDKAMDIPFLKGTLVAEDGKAVALYLPLTSKDQSYRVYSVLTRAAPAIWRFGPVDLAWRRAEGESDAPAETWRTLRRVAQMAAFQTGGADEFERVLTELVEHVTAGDLAEGRAALEAAVHSSEWEGGLATMLDDEAEEVRERIKAKVDKLRPRPVETDQKTTEPDLPGGLGGDEPGPVPGLNGAGGDEPGPVPGLDGEEPGKPATETADERQVADKLSEAEQARLAELERELRRHNINAARQARRALLGRLQDVRGTALVREVPGELATLWLDLAEMKVRSFEGRVLSARELTAALDDLAADLEDLAASSEALASLPEMTSAALEGHRAFPGEDALHVTGLPVAEDTFGVQMFKQMAISAPMAMAVVFVLMLIFFRKLVLVISPMIVAMVAVISTMGLLIATGQTIHIMSSMIPIFIMPIAVLDAIHILSDFFDRYQETRDRRRTILAVMKSLFVPMLYTSLTTAAGFASLALTPIPPVQVFGLYVAFGVMVAWAATILFIPAYIMFIPSRRLENFGLKRDEDAEHGDSMFARALRRLGRATYRRWHLILAGTAVAVAVAIYGISLIHINDNPTKWFEAEHPIREADRVLNKHFGGTYMAYLALAPEGDLAVTDATIEDLTARAEAKGETLVDEVETAPAVFGALAKIIRDEAKKIEKGAPRDKLLDRVADAAEAKRADAEEAAAEAWNRAALWIDTERQADETFKDPEVLRTMVELQQFIEGLEAVGKSNSLADLVKTVYRELGGGEAYFRIPDTRQGVAGTILQYENSHRPRDVAHFVVRNEDRPDLHYRRASIWIQLTSGDNREMQRVVQAVALWRAATQGDTDAVRDLTARHPEALTSVLAGHERLASAAPLVRADPAKLAAAIREGVPAKPHDLKHDWFGLTYINVVWQDRMVRGMLQAFLGSFLVVLLMMTILFRSALWGLLSMVPLTVTVGMIYGIVGLVGKDYDMPTAVLSSLTLGLAVDYAIHFLARSREARRESDSWKDAVPKVFGEPARAISRNVVVVGVGFLPLLAAPLVPYQTVGIFMVAILLLAGVASLLILPALIRPLGRLLFPKTRACCLVCNSATCIISMVAAVALIALNIHQFLEVGWSPLLWVSLPSVVVLALLCGLSSYREKCRRRREATEFEKGDQS